LIKEARLEGDKHLVEVHEEKEHRSLGEKIKDALGLGGSKEEHQEHVRYGPDG